MSATGDWWAEQVTAWGESGLTGRDYALSAGVNEGTLRNWKSRLARRSEGPKVGRADRPGFVEVVLHGDQPGRGAEDATLELVLPNGVRVRIPAGFNPVVLQRVLQVLECR